MTEAVERIRKEVGKNSIPLAFDLLETELRNAKREEELNQLTTLRSDYAAISRKQIIGVVTHVDETRRREIIYQILVLASDLLKLEENPENTPPTPPDTSPTDTPSSPEEVIDQIRMVVITANAKDDFPLRLTDEVNVIIKAVQVSNPQCKLRFAEPHTRLSAQLMDLMEALVEAQPHIIHFAGHGSEEGHLRLMGVDGSAEELRPSELIDFLKTMRQRSPLKGIVFNLCHSENLLEQAAAHFDFVIGWQGELPDNKGIKFAEFLYRALALNACKFGEMDFVSAFSMAKSMLNIKIQGTEEYLFLKGKKVDLNS
jgi:hypothetical protein